MTVSKFLLLRRNIATASVHDLKGGPITRREARKIRTCMTGMNGQRYELFHVSVENRGVVGKEGMIVARFTRRSCTLDHLWPANLLITNHQPLTDGINYIIGY